MPGIRELLATTSSRSVTLVAPSDAHHVATRSIKRVVLLQDLAGLDTLPSGGLVIVPSGLFSRQDASGLDVLIKRVAERGAIAALVQGLTRPRPRIQRVAERYDVVVLGCPEQADLGEIITALSVSISGGPADTLLRVTLALDRIQEWSLEPEESPAALVSDVSSIIKETLHYASGLPFGYEVRVNGRTMARIGTGEDSVLSPEARIVVPALVNAITSRLEQTHERTHALEEERSRALTSLIIAESAATEHYAAAARRSGAEVDGFHQALVVHSASEDPVVRDLEFRAVFEGLSDQFASTPLQVYSTRLEASLTVIFACTADLTWNDALTLTRINEAIGNVRLEGLRWGLGSTLAGPAGLRTSVSEARSAANEASSEGISDRVLRFDATGVQRLISELRASVTAGHVAEELLLPLGEHKNRDTLIETLNIWIEERGSLKAAAQRLFLHPNAVSYRINKIKSLLDRDLEDPSVRFALQVACRVLLPR